MAFATLATFFSAISFLGFGISCQTSDYMKREFIRYGYDRERPLTGYLQILGGIGLIAGYYVSPPLAMAAAAGLSLMMAYGFGVRMYIRDTLLQATPAFLYAALNGYLALHYAGLL
ncbi:DoxX-like protein [Neolewinella xylanilytica]|uniref:DoxX-like protein n=1 Tax=Neolewinella xylanilytica TaxID=1514080 RepID=A0A2S6I4E0_9BACT|nr:DoxX family protein [Neolewinella xylanilytica]PPK86034.1 DoxX-like protein [Neolewinella xylanilytica]